MSAPYPPREAPARALAVWHAAALAVGMVIGAGIFKTSAEVARHVSDAPSFFAAWGLGGLFALAGALCYAELAAAFPGPGGDYWFLRRAFGRTTAFLFAWSRFAVIFTGSTALLAFVLSDYLGEIVKLGPDARAAVAIGAILLLTCINLVGVRIGVTVQIALVVLDTVALLLLGLAGWLLAAGGTAPLDAAAAPAAAMPSFGAAMVFVMLAYGGWNDAATLSTEMRDGARAMVRALVGGMLVVTALYLLANWGYWRGLGLGGLAASPAPAAALMARAFGPWGEIAMVTLVALTALAVMNALIIVGGRTTWAAAGDVPALRRLGRWNVRRGTPRAAIVAQSAVAMLLVGYGTWTRQGFATMVDFLSPVFWLFLTLSGAAVLVLRHREPSVPRPFRVPLYPWLPILFTASSAYVLWSTIVYVGGAGVALSFGVLAAGGAVLMALSWRRGRGNAG